MSDDDLLRRFEAAAYRVRLAILESQEREQLHRERTAFYEHERARIECAQAQQMFDAVKERLAEEAKTLELPSIRTRPIGKAD